MSAGDFGRRTWDREEYARQARERYSKSRQDVRAPKGPEVRREALDFKKDLNKRQIITTTVTGTRGKLFGFYCSVCDLTFKDNLKYLDHLNSKPHLIKSGEIDKLSKRGPVTLDMIKQTFSEMCERYDKHGRALMRDGGSVDHKKRKLNLRAAQASQADSQADSQAAGGDSQASGGDFTAPRGNDSATELSQVVGITGFGSTKK